MAKIIEGPLQPDATASSRGNLSIRRTRHGTVAQAWPRARGRGRSGYALYKQEEFALAAMWAADPEPIGLQTAINLVRGTTQVPRDLIMASEYGTHLDIGPIDGVQPVSYRVVAPNAQLILDQVTDEVGALLLRASIGWVAILAGNNGHVLTMDAGLPEWMPATGGGGAGIVTTLFDTPGIHTYAVPPNATTLDVTIIGGGGGGGSGRRTAVGIAASGGGGGGGGAIMTARIRTTNLPADLNIIVGAAGGGGASQTIDSQNGNPGAPGGSSSIGWDVFLLQAAPGSAGNSGSTGTVPAAAGGTVGRYLGGNGGNQSVGANGGPGQIMTAYGASGGGGGGGLPATPVNRHGGSSGRWGPSSGMPAILAGGGNATTQTPPEDGYSVLLESLSGTGAGGGYALATGVAVAGANGGLYGGGGGGGGASLNGNNSGAGGNGARGAVLISAY